MVGVNWECQVVATLCGLGRRFHRQIDRMIVKSMGSLQALVVFGVVVLGKLLRKLTVAVVSSISWDDWRNRQIYDLFSVFTFDLSSP